MVACSAMERPLFLMTYGTLSTENPMSIFEMNTANTKSKNI